MSAAPQVARALTVAGDDGPRLPAARRRRDAAALIRLLAARLAEQWLPRAAWTLSRTGRPGLVGMGLLVATALLLFSTHLKVAAEVEALRADLAAAQGRARGGATDKAAGQAAARGELPERADLPELLRRLFDEAARARLAIDTAKYDLNALSSGSVVRYQIAFPVTGPYPQIRAFVDSTLAQMPSVALSDLVLERKSIGAGDVEAQIRMTVYTSASGAAGLPGVVGSASALAVGTSDRVVAPAHAAALFARHSWYVPPPPRRPPPPVELPQPEPTAPPLPYAFAGQYAPGGDAPVYVLSQGDRVITAHVGDHLDGVWQLESAGDGELVFVYLPLNLRQTLATGASR